MEETAVSQVVDHAPRTNGENERIGTRLWMVGGDDYRSIAWDEFATLDFELFEIDS